MNIKYELQDYYKLYFPDSLIKELEDKGAKKISDVFDILKKDYIKTVHKYILNDYKLVDSFGTVKFKGSLLIIDPNQSLYSNGVELKFEDYIGLGAIDSLFKAIKTELNKEIEIYHYGSSAIKSIEIGFNDVSSESKVITLIGIKDKSEKIHWGIGESSNALRSAVDALLSSINRMERIS